MAEELAELVLAGKKRVTCWSASEGPKTEAGKRWVVLDGSGDPVAVIGTVALTQRRFDEVDEAFAFDDGEADRTLASWRRAHRNYFSRQGTYAPDMLLCHRPARRAVLELPRSIGVISSRYADRATHVSRFENASCASSGVRSRVRTRRTMAGENSAAPKSLTTTISGCADKKASARAR